MSHLAPHGTVSVHVTVKMISYYNNYNRKCGIRPLYHFNKSVLSFRPLSKIISSFFLHHIPELTSSAPMRNLEIRIYAEAFLA